MTTEPGTTWGMRGSAVALRHSRGRASVERAGGTGAPVKPVRILVVDDEECIQRLLKSILRRRSYQVQLASNGDEALD